MKKKVRGLRVKITNGIFGLSRILLSMSTGEKQSGYRSQFEAVFQDNLNPTSRFDA